MKKISTVLAVGATSAGMLLPAVASAEEAVPVDVKFTFCTDELDGPVEMNVVADAGMFEDWKLVGPEAFAPANEAGLYCVTYVETVDSASHPIYADIFNPGATKVTIKVEQVVLEPAGSLSFGSLGGEETETLKVIGEAEGVTYASVSINS